MSDLFGRQIERAENFTREEALAALDEVAAWISKELPIPTHGATSMLIKIRGAIDALSPPNKPDNEGERE